MTPVFHVFRKDIRHLWKEIVLSLLLLSAYAWRVPRDWYTRQFSNPFVERYLHPTLAILLLASWWLLVVRLVHAERLVGDRQFWLTRPYEWKRLLCEKILFLVVTIQVPLLFVQMCLLGFAGFLPYPHWFGLFWVQALTFLTLLLPALALSAITASLGQAILALVALVLYMIATAALLSFVPGSSFPLPEAGLGDVQLLLLIFGCIAAVVLQYSRRWTMLSIGVLGGTALVISIILFATPYSLQIDRAYPELKSDSAALLHIAIDPKKPPKPDVDLTQHEDKIPLQLPLYFSTDSEAGLEIEGIRVTFESGDARWRSDWISQSHLLMANRVRYPLDLEIERAVYERMRSASAKAKIVAAFEALGTVQQWQAVVEEGDFSLPEVGRCVINHESFGDSLKCRAPLHGPRMLVMSVDAADNVCPAIEGSNQDGSDAKSEPPISTKVYSSFLANDSDPAELDISPVQTFNVYFDRSWRFGSNARLCPGTQITFRRVEIAKEGRVELNIPELNLADYRLSNRFVIALR